MTILPTQDFLYDFQRSVRRPAVDDDVFYVVIALIEDASNASVDVRLTVEDSGNDGEFQMGF